jgi:Fe-S-cluster containining protein
VVRSLSFHGRYRCAHSGACCTAGWPIALESAAAARVEQALSRGMVQARLHATFADRDASGAALLAADDLGCAFYDPDARRCHIHRALGHAALPLACRQFPRVSLRDPRGVSVTLSHYCPTAARLLELDESPVAIVEQPPAFPAIGEYVGLDATGVLPPLLRPGLLMDWEAWWECERLAVDLLGNWAGPPGHAVTQLARVVATIQKWDAGRDESLAAHVRAAFMSPRDEPVPLPTRQALVAAARDAIPADLRPHEAPRAMRPPDRVVCRYLAAHAFASWTVHGRGGLDAWLGSIATALALVDSGFGVRDADLWLRHLAQ